LLAITLPLNYILTLKYGVEGTATANLIAITVYNSLRYLFLLKKFNMQPFSAKTVYSILLGAVCFLICYFLFNAYQGIGWIFLRSSVFVLLFVSGVLLLDLSPDVLPVWESVRNRFRKR
jgi:O-antigen/teichoic acid export membrane protein